MPTHKPRQGHRVEKAPAVDEFAILRAEIVKLGERIAELTDAAEMQKVTTVAGIPVTGAALQMEPGDILVISTPEDLEPAEMDRLHTALGETMAKFNVRRWMLMTGGLTLETATREQLEKILEGMK